MPKISVTEAVQLGRNRLTRDPEEAEKDIADSMGDRKQLRGVPGLGPEVWPNGLLPPGKGRLARQSMASRQFEENLGLMGLS